MRSRTSWLAATLVAGLTGCAALGDDRFPRLPDAALADAEEIIADARAADASPAVVDERSAPAAAVDR